MDLTNAMQGGDRITKQRNLFLVLTILLAVTSFALSLKILMQEERIIMVPPLTSEVMISNRKVSSSYLEQMTMVFLNSLLDLSSMDVLHKRDMILKYTSNSHPSFAKRINEYFADSAEKYKNFDLVTYFTVKNMEIDEGNGEVIAQVKELIESVGANILFLPTYSPDLNPIEHYWFKIKNEIRKVVGNFASFYDAVFNTIKLSVP